MHTIVWAITLCYHNDIVAKFNITIQIKSNLNFSFSRRWLREIITVALNLENLDKPVEIDCDITDNDTIRKLNKVYRGIDRPTDVLSFAFTQSREEDLVYFPEVTGNPQYLGEIIVSYPKAVEQAQHLGHSLEEELRLLLVHGVLHLVGYDHEKDSDARKMRARESIIIKYIQAQATT
jgi:probable rRNA maturation factor